MQATDNTITWLLEGDPAIRWQVLRDLLDAPEEEWQAERRKTLSEGWGARFLDLQDADGGWGGGIYTPKWTSATYTLLTLCAIGIPRDCPAARRGAERVLAEMIGDASDSRFHWRLEQRDRCIVGMLLQIAVYFEMDAERIDALAANLLHERMPDGGWNCRRARRPRPVHSSFHTTFNVLEGLREYIESPDSVTGATALRPEILAAERDALEFMLQHRLFRSDKTGQIINDRFLSLSFPPRWHYDVLRGLEYFARAGADGDPRLQDAIDLLRGKRRGDGTWPVQHKHAGRVFFDMEKTGGPSRWNTLRALRVLKWWTADGPQPAGP